MPDDSLPEDHVPIVDYASLQTPNPRPSLSRRLKQHFSTLPPLWKFVLVGLLGADIAYSKSHPFGFPRLPLIGYEFGLLGVCIVTPCFWLFAADYAARSLVCLIRHRLCLRDVRSLAMLFIIATIVASLSDRPLRWRFSANRATLDSTVATLLQSASSNQVLEAEDLDCPDSKFTWYGRQVGEYQVYFVGVFPGERVVYLETGGFFRSGWGFLYDPDRHINGPMIDLTPLEDGWLIFYYAKP